MKIAELQDPSDTLLGIGGSYSVRGLTLDVFYRWSASVVPLIVILFTLRTHRALADNASQQASADDALSPEQKRELQYKSFAGLLSTMLIVSPHSIDVSLVHDMEVCIGLWKKTCFRANLKV